MQDVSTLSLDRAPVPRAAPATPSRPALTASVAAEAANRGRPGAAAFEIAIAVFALASLLAAQSLLVATIHGASYRGPDGGMVQSVVLTALRFGDFFNITNINPVQGIGSQLLPKNAWVNPALWPFAFFDREVAVEISVVVALGVYAAACYLMARCFDLPVVPSALVAQFCILLFAPAAYFYDTPRNFVATPADAVTYAPYLLALGLLVRLEQGARQFILVTVGITACVLYSIYSDPAFTTIPAFGWSVAFATVAVLAPRPRIAALRLAALACCFAVLLASGAMIYLYTFSHFSARVEYAHVVDRVRGIGLVTLFSRPSWLFNFYLAFAAGWLAGLIVARGRPRVLIVAAILSFVCYVAYGIVYLLLLDAPWLLPIPLYIEQCLFALYAVAAAAGWWALLQKGAGLLGLLARRLRPSAMQHDGAAIRRAEPAIDHSGSADAGWWPRLAGGLAVLLSLLVVAVIPARAAIFALQEGPRHADSFYWPWAQETELVQFLSGHTRLTVGGPFRGSFNILTGNNDGTINDLHSRGIPGINEYSQTASPTSLYFLHKMTRRNVLGLLNRFEFFWRNGTYAPNFWALSQLLGVRFTVERWPLEEENNPGFHVLTFPYRAPNNPNGKPPGVWYVYEMPRPNLGDYSPTEVTVAASGEDITAAMHAPDFDFARQVVLNAPVEASLVPANSVRMTLVRNGLHLSAHSDGTSLIVLPQQFSHCLRPKDRNVRLVRADLLLTGVIFSGDIDTDITFDYGLFSPWCRMTDIADVKTLALNIDLRRPHLTGGRLFYSWNEGLERLKAAAARLGL